MLISQFLLLSAVLFCVGIYGVLARRNGVMVLMSIELILNAVNINFVAFSVYHNNIAGDVFGLFVSAPLNSTRKPLSVFSLFSSANSWAFDPSEAYWHAIAVSTATSFTVADATAPEASIPTSTAMFFTVIS